MRNSTGILLMGLVLLLLLGCQQRTSTPGLPKFGSAKEALDYADAVSEQAVKTAPSELQHARVLWRTAKACYEIALGMAPKDSNICFSYAVTLGDEAAALADSDLREARLLWAAAGLQYDRALRHNPLEHRAANSWGLDLVAEADAIHRDDLPAARALWHKAAEKYAQALAIDPAKSLSE